MMAAWQVRPPRLVTIAAARAASVRFRAASALVAAGRFDAFWEADLKVWDVAAGLLLV